MRMWVALVACLAFFLATSGASRLPYSASIVGTEDSDVLRTLPSKNVEKGTLDPEANSTHYFMPSDLNLPFSCQQQGCGPDVACPGSNSLSVEAAANCYLYQGMFLCCTISPLGSRR